MDATCAQNERDAQILRIDANQLVGQDTKTFERSDITQELQGHLFLFNDLLRNPRSFR